MKNLIFASLLAFFAVSSCQNAQPKPGSTTQETTIGPAAVAPSPAVDSAVVYTCPMHPEVTGKKGDKCPKCKMDLVEKK